ncbi:hypothetical protein Tco_0112744, partial [Tanacetum coccineum]
WNSNSNSCRDVAVLFEFLEPALNLSVHCCGLEFRVLNGYDQKSFDEDRGLNCVVQTSFDIDDRGLICCDQTSFEKISSFVKPFWHWFLRYQKFQQPHSEIFLLFIV